MTLSQTLIYSIWQTRNIAAQLLRPIASLFCLIVQIRCIAYRKGWSTSFRLPVPVIIIGNISVGGTGKTPLVIWLFHHLQIQGWKPGILTRGYRGKATQWPQVVTPQSDPYQVGDEAVLLARKCNCPVIAGPNRVIAGQMLIQNYACNLIICDDGLQHYALQRDIEIAVVDGQLRLGNGLCLPAGPLREPPQRLQKCNLVVINGYSTPEEFGMKLQTVHAIKLGDVTQIKPLTAFAGHEITAIAGIGNPQRFFNMLETYGLRLHTRPFPDHHSFCTEDFIDLIQNTILMTEKDVVKCERFLHDVDAWYVPVEAVLEPALMTTITQLTASLPIFIA
jgi:tetraacyldisaccharide 4'-kinase